MKSYQCIGCKHFLGAFEGGSHCKAFPPEKNKRIPSIIMRGIHDHTKPFEGDGGVRFESNGDFDDFIEGSPEPLPKDIEEF